MVGCEGSPPLKEGVIRRPSPPKGWENGNLDVLRIRNSSARPGTKAMLVFGEHARELITGETALGLVKALCGEGPSAKHAGEVLQNSEFVIVPNAIYYLAVCEPYIYVLFSLLGPEPSFLVPDDLKCLISSNDAHFCNRELLACHWR